MKHSIGRWWNGWIAGFAIRLVLLVPVLIAGVGLLFLLDLDQQVRNGGTVLPAELKFGHLLALAMVLTGPVALVVAIGECAATLLFGMTGSVHAVILGVPMIVGLLGMTLSMSVFIDPASSRPVSDRLFSLGGLLLFFLGGSLQVWAWQQWTDRPVRATPMAWYVLALLMTAGFLGTLIAWQAPSPYVRAVKEYYRDHWKGREDPPLVPASGHDDLPI
jgi:hypothetical protein